MISRAIDSLSIRSSKRLTAETRERPHLTFWRHSVQQRNRYAVSTSCIDRKYDDSQSLSFASVALHRFHPTSMLKPKNNSREKDVCMLRFNTFIPTLPRERRVGNPHCIPRTNPSRDVLALDCPPFHPQDTEPPVIDLDNPYR